MTAVLLKVDPDGQAVIGKDVVESLGARPGDRLELRVVGGGRAELKREKPLTFADLAGSLKRPGQPVLTIEEMNEAIAEAWAGER